MLISFVVPIYNEEDCVVELQTRLCKVISALKGFDFEMIFVDDGSRDQTLERVKQLCQSDKRVKLISLSRNFGHQVALSAGLDHASGDAVIVMDADLQHPPELIPELVRKWEEGYEVVHTIRQETIGSGWFKGISSAVFYWLINRLTKVTVIPNAADFRLLDRKAVDALCAIREQSRFIRGLTSWIGYRQAAVPYVAAPRFAGRSKYSLKKMSVFALDGIFSFSAFPLRIATYFGLMVSFISFVYAVYAIYARLFTDAAVPGWTSVLVVILFLGGVQLISMGAVGEYVNRIYNEVKRRPMYLIRETIGLNKEDY